MERGLLAFVARLYSVLGSHGVKGRIKGLQILLAHRIPNVVWILSMGLTSDANKGKSVCDLFIAARWISLRSQIFEWFRRCFTPVFDHFTSVQAISTSVLIHLFLLILSNRIYSPCMNEIYIGQSGGILVRLYWLLEQNKSPDQVREKLWPKGGTELTWLEPNRVTGSHRLWNMAPNEGTSKNNQ